MPSDPRYRLRHSAPPPTLHVEFGGTEVATLTKVAGQFHFRYLPAFADRDLASLPGLPDPTDTAVRHLAELPRFFRERIPDTVRPEIREQITLLGIEPDDQLCLLGTLSRHALTDPFELRFERAA